MEHLIFKLNQYHNAHLFKKIILKKDDIKGGIYIEGKYGVGKTHLLASAYSAFTGRKAYVSFTDLTILIHHFGIETVRNEFIDIELVCIDEFELDDPGNTMMITNFLRFLLQNETFVITTSNTIPEELGSGRFNVKDFGNEIGSIESQFRTIQINGEDYRKKDYEIDYVLQSKSPEVDDFYIEFDDLKDQLKSNSMLKIMEFVRNHKSWFINDLDEFTDQGHALRFCHFIDKIYDYGLGLHFSLKSETIFSEEFLEGSFEKKYKRCISRCFELSNH